MRWLIAIALAFSVCGARAQAAEVPEWFAESFLEFPQDVKDAAGEGKRLMLYFWQAGCPYCRQLKEITLADPALVKRMQQHFVPVALNIFGAREAQWVDGRRMSEKDLTQALKIRATPTLLFLDEKGAIALRLTGYVPPEQFAKALENAAPRR
jgi:thioredoxin-related protein